MSAPEAIDCHAHVLAKERKITSDRHVSPGRDYTIDELLQIFKEHGISRGLLTAPSYYLTDNSLLLSALARAPVLRGTVNLQPDTTMAEIEALGQKGVCGMRLNWWRKKELPDIKIYRDLLAKIKAANWHLELFLDGVNMPHVLPTVKESGVKLVLDHFGCPDPVDGVASLGFRMMLDMVSSGQAWVKLSAPYRLNGGDPKLYAHALLSCAGPQRLMWASDWPWGGFEEGMTYQRCLDWLVEWIPDENARRIVLCETPRKLFGFQ